MKKNKIIAIIVLIIICIACATKEFQNDTFYLIKLGQYISKNGIDLLDHFSWIPNLVYTYPHWLYSLFTYFIYNNWGFDGLYISNIMVYISIILSIYYICIKRTKDSFLAFFISFISIMTLKSFIVLRSQAISILLFLWEVYYINKLIETGNKKYILYLMLDSLLIANIHGTAWLMFFVFYLPFLVSHLVYSFIKKKKKKKYIFDYRISIEQIKNIKLLLLSFVFTLLMGLLTPSRICYTYIFKTMQGISQSHIAEHTPLMIIYAPIIIIVLFLLFFVKRKVKLHEFFMISGLLLMSFRSFRHTIFIYSIGLIYLAVILKREINPNDKTFNILNKKMFSNKIYTPIILVISLLCCSLSIYNNMSIDYINESIYPVNAVKYIKENLPYKDIRLFNNYDFGSYLMLNDIKVFIDSRCDLYLKEFGNSDIFEEFVNIKDKYEYEDIFDKYDIQYALLYNKEALNHIIKKDEKYKNIYQDDYFTLYERKVLLENEK